MITVTIAVYGRKTEKVNVDSIEKIPDFLYKWQGEEGITNRDLKKSHGNIEVDGIKVGQCAYGRLKMNEAKS